MTATTIAPKMANAAQASFILSLRNVAKDDDNRPEMMLAIEQGMTSREASKEIDALKAAKAVAASLAHLNITPAAPVKVAAPAFVVEKGQWHALNGALYVIAKSQSTGKLYAKRRDMDNGGFEFAPGMVFKFGADTKVGPQHIDMIKAFGEQHDRCVFCFLPLDVPESRMAGYGEKCASNNGLPYGNH